MLTAYEVKLYLFNDTGNLDILNELINLPIPETMENNFHATLLSLHPQRRLEYVSRLKPDTLLRLLLTPNQEAFFAFIKQITAVDAHSLMRPVISAPLFQQIPNLIDFIIRYMQIHPDRHWLSLTFKPWLMASLLGGTGMSYKAFFEQEHPYQHQPIEFFNDFPIDFGNRYIRQRP